jgi:hypothetical protein
MLSTELERSIKLKNKLSRPLLSLVSSVDNTTNLRLIEGETIMGEVSMEAETSMEVETNMEAETNTEVETSTVERISMEVAGMEVDLDLSEASAVNKADTVDLKEAMRDVERSTVDAGKNTVVLVEAIKAGRKGVHLEDTEVVQADTAVPVVLEDMAVLAVLVAQAALKEVERVITMGVIMGKGVLPSVC